MTSLVALVALVGVAAAAPQQYWNYGGFVVKDGTNYESTSHPMKLIRALVPLQLPANYYYVSVPFSADHDTAARALVPVAIQDTNRGLVPTLQDTPAVRAAKELHSELYEKAAVAAFMDDVPATPVRRRRDVEDETQRQAKQLLAPYPLPQMTYWPQTWYHYPGLRYL